MTEGGGAGREGGSSRGEAAGPGPPWRVAVCCAGSRGDFQPILGLCLHLQAAGMAVRVFTNPEHLEHLKGFGLEGIAIGPEMKNITQRKSYRRMMLTGEMLEMAAASDTDDSDGEEKLTEEQQLEEHEKQQHDIWNAFEEFQPHVATLTSMAGMFIGSWLHHHPSTSTIGLHLQPNVLPSNLCLPTELQRAPLDPDQPRLTWWIYLLQQKAAYYFGAVMELQKHGYDEQTMVSNDELWYGLPESPEQGFDGMFKLEETNQLHIMAYSPAFSPLPPEWPQGGFVSGKGSIEIVGRCFVPSDLQVSDAEKGGGFFANDSHGTLVDFLAAGPPPVYIGWGSMWMHSKEHMTWLAVEALRQAGKRGIILGGWAGLTCECLDEAENAEELRAYCADSVLFLKSAPHEWLFPRCGACVHHGGIGTMQASLGAGCPTICTPCIYDQFDNARFLNQIGAGLGITRLRDLRPEELGAAIRRCTEDPQIIAAAKRVAEQMSKENAGPRAAEIIDQFVREQVVTGKWVQRQAAISERWREERRKNLKLSMEGLFSKWTVYFHKTFPVMRDFQKKQMALMAENADLIKEGKLWAVVNEKGCLARQGESIRSAEVGRFGYGAVMELLAENKKKDRFKMKRRRGTGPDQGWVSLAVGGKEILYRLQWVQEVGGFEQARLGKLFEDFNNKLAEKDKQRQMGRR